MHSCIQLQSSFNRPNLHYAVIAKEGNGMEQVCKVVADLCRSTVGSGIVYTLSKKNSEEVAVEIMAKTGIKTASYHGGMSASQRRHAQASWNEGSVRVMVATIAFGMGINKSDVRFVVHHAMPKRYV
jgi:bloom syndrome protein